MNGLNDFVEEDIPAAKPPRGSSKYKSPVKLIYIHNSPGNCPLSDLGSAHGQLVDLPLGSADDVLQVGYVEDHGAVELDE